MLCIPIISGNFNYFSKTLEYMQLEPLQIHKLKILIPVIDFLNSFLIRLNILFIRSLYYKWEYVVGENINLEGLYVANKFIIQLF